MLEFPITIKYNKPRLAGRFLFLFFLGMVFSLVALSEGSSGKAVFWLLLITGIVSLLFAFIYLAGLFAGAAIIVYLDRIDFFSIFRKKRTFYLQEISEVFIFELIIPGTEILISLPTLGLVLSGNSPYKQKNGGRLLAKIDKKFFGEDFGFSLDNLKITPEKMRDILKFAGIIFNEEKSSWFRRTIT